MASLKGPGEAQAHDGILSAAPRHRLALPLPLSYFEDEGTTLPSKLTAQISPGSNLRIAIVHARWNTAIISALVSGARKSLLASGVRECNIVVQDVPGSYELPLAVQR